MDARSSCSVPLVCLPSDSILALLCSALLQVTVFRFVVENSVEQKMVERATKKLYLDALVVKQGRVHDTDKMSAGELQEMVRFGANRIFQGADTQQLTEEDIDAILARGEELTRKQNEKLKVNAQNDLLNFNAQESVVYESISRRTEAELRAWEQMQRQQQADESGVALQPLQPHHANSRAAHASSSSSNKND